MTKRGRPREKSNILADLIFNHVGEGKRFRTQSQLRQAAEVGSAQLTILRAEPGKLQKTTIIKLADAVGLSAARALKLAGYSASVHELRRMRRAISENASRRRAEEHILRMPAAEFFHELGHRAGERPFLIAGAFGSRPLGPEDGDVTQVLVRLIADGKLFIAMHVPWAAGGTGPLADRYASAYEAVKTFVETLIFECTKSGERAVDDVRKQVAVFVLNLDPVACRALLPPAVSDERSSLIVFDRPDIMVPERRCVLACWRNLGRYGDPMVDVLHDPQPPEGLPENLQQLNEWKDYFQCVLNAWEAGIRDFRELPSDSVWRHCRELFSR